MSEMQSLSWLYTKMAQIAQPQCFGNGVMPGHFIDTDRPQATVRANREDNGGIGVCSQKNILRLRPLEVGIYPFEAWENVALII